MAIAMVAMLAFGGTYAYFTASSNSEDVEFTTGTVKLEANTFSTIATTNPIVSGMELLGTGEHKVAVTNASTVDTYIFVTFSVEFENVTDATLAASKTEYDSAAADSNTYFLDVTTTGSKFVQLTNGKEGAESKNVANVYYFKAETADYSSVLDVCTSVKFYAKSANKVAADGTETEGILMAKKVTLTLGAESIQVIGEADGLEMTVQQAYQALGHTIAA